MYPGAVGTVAWDRRNAHWATQGWPYVDVKIGGVSMDMIGSTVSEDEEDVFEPQASWSDRPRGYVTNVDRAENAELVAMYELTGRAM